MENIHLFISWGDRSNEFESILRWGIVDSEIGWIWSCLFIELTQQQVP